MTQGDTFPGRSFIRLLFNIAEYAVANKNYDEAHIILDAVVKVTHVPDKVELFRATVLMQRGLTDEAILALNALPNQENPLWSAIMATALLNRSDSSWVMYGERAMESSDVPARKLVIGLGGPFAHFSAE